MPIFIVHLLKDYQIEARDNEQAKQKAIAQFKEDGYHVYAKAVQINPDAIKMLDEMVARHKERVLIEARRIAIVNKHKKVTEDDLDEAIRIVGGYDIR